MAQIWVTYEELAVLCNCDSFEARASVRLRGWPQRRCSDGQMRLKLPDDLSYAYMMEAVGHSDLNRLADAQVSTLKGILRDRDGLRASNKAKAA